AQIFRAMEPLRLGQAKHEEIASSLLSDNLDSWWLHYRSFKQNELVSRQTWIDWRQNLKLLVDYNPELWPEKPEVLAYPEELVRVHRNALQQRVEKLLREKTSGAARHGQGFRPNPPGMGRTVTQPES
ncbi:unnamed protein product, partial [Polarella glacialis]